MQIELLNIKPHV